MMQEPGVFHNWIDLVIAAASWGFGMLTQWLRGKAKR